MKRSLILPLSGPCFFLIVDRDHQAATSERLVQEAPPRRFGASRFYVSFAGPFDLKSMQLDLVVKL